MKAEDKHKIQRHKWQNKLISGEITIDEYNRINPRIRMGSDNGLEDAIDIIP